MVAMEPTGHYWFAFVAFLKKYDVQVVLVAPQHVKHSKEMDDNTQEKDDRKDPIVIARLVPEGRYLIPYIPEDVFAELRVRADHETWSTGITDSICSGRYGNDSTDQGNLRMETNQRIPAQKR